MIETLILGFLLGMISTGLGAAYAAYRFIKRPYFLKEMPEGYSVIGTGIGFENDPNGYVGFRKDGKILAGIKYDDKGITDIIYDI